MPGTRTSPAGELSATINPPSGDRVLRYAALLYAAGFAFHNGDHLRRGMDVLTGQVLWAGTLTGLVAIAAIVLALMGHRLAPPLAVAHGFSQALGVAAVHLLPRWSAFSDSLPDGNVDALSWAAVIAEVAGAFVFGAAGVYVMRRSRRHASRAAGPLGTRQV
jgi:hypothetical protein